VPFNYLHNIPYHLITSVRRLIDAGQLTEVVVAPTINTQTKPSTVPRRERASCLFVGVNSPEVDADAEYEIVSSHFTEMSRLIDAEATPEAIVSGCARHDVVHFACHGDFDLLRNANYLVLPEGRLYPATLASMTNNRCQLVLMNSCISGIVAREARNGDQALGLSNALLYAGTEAVVATLWQLEPEPAIEFADTFYSLWQEADKTTAAVVLEAQKALRARYPGDVLSWGAHAFFGNWC
jgi:CHAT domain-containing protein